MAIILYISNVGYAEVTIHRIAEHPSTLSSTIFFFFDFLCKRVGGTDFRLFAGRLGVGRQLSMVLDPRIGTRAIGHLCPMALVVLWGAFGM